jgi:hypothetical protein
VSVLTKTINPTSESTLASILPSEPDDMAEEEYLDEANDALEEGGLANDGFSYLLSHVIGLNEDVC